MDRTDVWTWKIGGVGGAGLQIASSFFGKAFVRSGWYAHVSDQFPSIIKGGPAAGQVSVSQSVLRGSRRSVDMLVALSRQSIVDHAAELSTGGWLVYDQDTMGGAPDLPRSDIVAFPVPLTKLTRDIGGEKIMRNVVALGATFGVLSFPTAVLNELIRQEYERKGQRVVDVNVKAVEAGAAYARQHAPAASPWTMKPSRSRNRLFWSGNDALSIGAIAAGCSFYSGYPMTPSSSILMFMAKHGPERGMVVRQLQDEIAVINEAIGAAHAGVRSMVATSGGGFSLMVEAYGLAAMTETPLVIVNAQRPGPATGLPTWTEQGDLRFVLHAAQGDFPRVVLAPSDPVECFSVMPLAFNLADRYQTPVIVLTDKELAENVVTCDPPSTRGLSIDRGPIVSRGKVDGDVELFARYAEVPSGVSPRPYPGTPGLPYMANSDEHDVHGLSNERPAVRIAQHGKRLRKMAGLAGELTEPEVIGPRRAEVSVLTWGSSKGPVLDALDLLSRQGIAANAMVPMAMSPFPTKAVGQFLHQAKRLVVIENNATGQFAGLIQEQIGAAVPDRIVRSDGRQFEAVELSVELTARVGKTS